MLQEEARQIREKAERIIDARSRVKGDAEKAKERKRKELDGKIRVDGPIFSWIYGKGTVKKINRKTCRVLFGTSELIVDKSLLKAIE